MNISAERPARVRVARDHALRIVQKNGQWESCGPLKVLLANVGDMKIVHRTAFSAPPDRQVCLSYQHALAKQVARPDLPYTIEMWSDLKKVLFVQWDQNDELQVFSFRPGEWEVRLAERAAQDEGGK